MKKMWSFLRLLPLLMMAVGAVWLLLSRPELSVEEILNYAPADRVQATLFLWLAFAAKSLSLMLPVMLLFAVSGVLFPLPIALLINTVGISITLTLPYLVGRLSGPDLSERLKKTHPRLEELRALRRNNGFIFSFLVRAIGILPCDIISLYMGNTRLPYTQYIAGGVLGFLPDLICATLVGMQISNMRSPWFWLTVGLNIALCVAAIFFYNEYQKKHKNEVP